MIHRRALLAGAAVATWALGAPVIAAKSDAFAPVVDSLRRLVETGELPFAALRIARHGRILAEASIPGVEPVGPGSIYRLYSMTKPVVAAGVMLLVEEGRLTLETPVARHVPEFADLTVIGAAPGRPEPAQTMTVAHLLTHACGLANSWGDARTAPLYRQAGLVAAAWMYDPAIGGLPEFARRLGGIPLEFQPGTDWLYGYGLDIAGLVIERISGERLGDFLKRRIFDPLGMASTGFHVRADDAHRLTGLYAGQGAARRKVETGAELSALRRPHADGGSAGLVSTLSDYGRFADMLAGGGGQVMSAKSASTLMSPYGSQDHIRPGLSRFFNGYDGFGQALAESARLDDDLGPGSAGEYGWGGAAGTSFWANRGSGLSVVLMTQLMGGGSHAAREALRPMIYRALAGA